MDVSKKNRFFASRIGQVWSGFEFSTKPDQPGLSSLIRLEVVMEQS